MTLRERALGAVAALFRFYPLLLPLFQLRRHLFLSLLWVVLWLIAFGQVGRGLGVPEIFYDPRTGLYPTWLTTFAWGAAYGLFIVAYHLVTFLLDGHHAAFLLREPHPFLQYVLNNSLLPIAFWLYYLHAYIQYHLHDPNLLSQILGHLCGFLCVLAGGLIFLTFFNRDIFRLKRLGLLPPQRIVQQVSHALGSPTLVRYYLAWPKGIHSTDRGLVLDRRVLVQLLYHHHRSAVLLEVGLLGLIVGWGTLQSIWEVYLPAGAAFLVLWAILYMLGGAISFWLRHWGVWAMVGVFILTLGLLYLPTLRGGGAAFGLAYTRPQVRREQKKDIAQDSLRLVDCLDAWQKRQGGQAPLVWVHVSGGGWRSAFWTLSNLQFLDSLSGGRLWQRTFAISGASGGLIGAAHWRELQLFYPHRRWDLSEAFFLTQDALNPILSTGLVGILSPSPSFYDSVSGERYTQGRGYAFERKLVQNARSFYQRRMRDYTMAERLGRCPLLFITPALLPMGRQLLISSQPCGPIARDRFFVDLQELVPDALNLRLTTALRMNASFPFVLPSVVLPTDPPMEAIDAGAIDNYGELIALRFIWHFREAIAQYASRVVLIEIRDLPEGVGVESSKPASLLTEFIQRLSGLYSSFAEARRLFTQMSYEVLRKAYPIPVEKHTIAFSPRVGRIPPLSFTLRPIDQFWMLTAVKDSLHQEKLYHLKGRIE